MLRRIPVSKDPRLIVGANTADDAGVYRLDRDRALVQTVDFFTPIVDEPFAFGQIAAANALSDVYAMGGRPLTAMNILAVPQENVGPETIARILRGGAATLKQARCTLVGGHTIRNPEPVYGLSVTGLVNPARMMTNARAKVGDVLILTKPLGTGIATTAIKRGLASASLERRVVTLMRRLNDVGTVVAEKGLVRAATDVTGFGLIGHLTSMCRASGVSARVYALQVPVIGPEIEALVQKGCVPGGSKDNERTASEHVDWRDASVGRRTILTDAQTSGGLLLCVRPRDVDTVRAILRKHRTISNAIVGEIVIRKRPSIVIH